MSDISALASLLRQHGDKILSGNHQLTLTASLLQRLNGAFCMIVEHDAHSSFQVVHTTNTKLHDLHFLHDFVQKVEALVISHGSSTLRGTVDISKFRSLRQLELRRIPLHMVSGLNLIQPRLKCITASRSLSRPCDLLGGGEGEPLPPASWPELRRLSLPHNTLCALDHSLRLTTTLREVDLSHNQLSEVIGLEVLPGLVVLDLSYNRLLAIPGLHRLACRTLRALSIAHNQLESLTGLENLNSLRTLHAGWNCLLESSSLAPLSRLTSLRHLWLEGNPLSRHVHHRERTARRLHPCTSSASQFMLNGTALSEQERRWVGAACLGLSTSSVLASSSTNTSESRQQAAKESRKGVRVREAVIADFEEHNTTTPSLNTSASLAPNCGSLVDISEGEHLETKRQIECLREKLGDSWLGAVPNVLGIPDSAAQLGSGSYQRHEAQAWLDSQQCPSPAAQVQLGQSPTQNFKPNSSERRSSLSTSDEPHSQLSTSPETDDSNEQQPLQPPPLLSLSADDSTLETKYNLHVEEEEDEEGSDPPFLVQKEMISARGDKIIKDFFLIIGPSMLVEREASGSSKVTARWPLDTLQSCERPAPGQLTLTFDTVRRDKQLRNYLMEIDDAQSISRTLGARLEARTLRDMNQVEFRCMRCSTYFSAEITGGMGCGGKRCPSCGSGVIVQEDVDLDAPAHDSPVLQLTHSDSQSSIGVTSTSATNAANNAASISTNNSGNVMVAAEIHPCSQTSSKKSSAASLDQSMCDSGLGLAGKTRHGEGADSDIEVLSNPSQSSIEILPPTDETHSREQSMAPSTELKASSTTRAPSKSPMGLTESSSSGSMTDSVCTAYESATSASLSNAIQISSSLGAVLGSFFQRLAHSPNPSASLLQQPVTYSYSDFSRVDHRLKLHLCMHQLKHDNEILNALLRSWIVPSTSTSGVPYSGLLVLSNQAMYVMRITGPEGDSPESWLTSEGSWPLSQVMSVLPTAWQYGINVMIQPPNGSNLHFTFLLGDVRHAPGFSSYISGLVPSTCIVRRADSDETTPQPQVAMPLLDQENATHFALAANFQHKCKQGSNIGYGPLAVTISSSHIALGKQDLRWMCEQQSESTSKENWAHIKPITSLMEVELSGNAPWLLRLRFMEEVHIDESQGELADNEDEWTLWFVSQRGRLGVTEALRTPWEKYFEVPLDVRIL